MNSPLHNEQENAARTAEAVARRSYSKLIAFLAVQTRDVSAAEDALSGAFAAAMVEWPMKGCPSNPEAWLLTVARRKTIDGVRRQRSRDLAADQIRVMSEGLNAETQWEIPDRRLALMFVCAHPAIDVAIRAPLMLQAVLGINAESIASAFLVSPATMGKRLVRAKDKIRQARIPFSVPEREELPDRLDAVLDAIYAAFTEGWNHPGETDIVRRGLTEEALFLSRLVTQLLPEQAEAIGLLALMLYVQARRGARRNPEGEYVPLQDQDPSLWSDPMISEAEALLHHAKSLGSIGRYQLEAALQSAHVHRCRTRCRNWESVLQLYDALLALTASPVVALNRALVVAEIRGPAAGLKELSETTAHERLMEYQPYWAARAELLAKTGAHSEARHAYEIAIGLDGDPSVRAFLQQRRASVGFDFLDKTPQ